MDDFVYSSNGKFKIALISGLVGLLTGFFSYGLLSKDVSKKSDVPYFEGVIYNQADKMNFVGFRDDFVPGMRADILHKGKERPLTLDSYSSTNYARFIIPLDVANRFGEFEVWATDVDGKRSAVKKLYVEKGLVSEERHAKR